MLTSSDILNNTKPERELYYELGRTFFAKDKFRKAIECLAEAKQLPGPPSRDKEIFILLGESYKNLSRIKDAFENYVEGAICMKEEADKLEFYTEAGGLINLVNATENIDFLKSKLDSQALRDSDSLRVHELLNQISQLKEQASMERSRSGSGDSIRNMIDECLALIGETKYQHALTLVEEAFTKAPDNNELLYLKIRILVEGGLDLPAATSLFNDEEFGYRKKYKESQILKSLHQLVAASRANGNSSFFAAFIGNLMDYDQSSIEGWIKQAESLGIKNEQSFPEIGLHLLKGEIAEKNNEPAKAADHFLEAAKCFYWQANYPEAKRYFEKVKELDPSRNDTYKYYADALFLLSHQSDPPYYDRSLIDKAYETWHSSPGKVVTNSADAWYYIVIARVHEVKYKFTESNFEKEYWQAALYVERSLVHDDKNSSFWNYLGRYYRNISMMQNSMLAFSIADSFNNTDEYLLEEKIMLLIDMGDFEKPLAYVAQLRSADSMQNERPVKPITYQSYHIYWEGFIKFHQGAFSEAIQLFNSLIEKDNNNLNGRHMRMLSYWYTANFEEAKTGAREILELGRKFTYSREEIIFGWATFISGDNAGAIAIVEDYARKVKSGSDHLGALCIFYLYAGQLEKAKAIFDQFIQWANNKLTIIQLLFGLTTIRKITREGKAQVYSEPIVLTDQITQWDLLLNQRLAQLSHEAGSTEDELMHKQKESSFEPASLPFVTIRTALARLKRRQKNLPESHAIYKELLDSQHLFPEVQAAIAQVETEVFKEAGELIHALDYPGTAALLLPIDLIDSEMNAKKHLLLSLVFFAQNEPEKSLGSFKDFYEQVRYNAELERQAWSELTNLNYDPTLAWQFSNFLVSRVHELQIPGTPALKSILSNFWNLVASKSTELYPVVSPVGVEISMDLLPAEADSPEWYVVSELVPAMRERIFQAFGIKPPGLRIRGNDVDLETGSYIILLDEIPLILGKVQKSKAFVNKTIEGLEELGIEGERSWSFSWMIEGCWVNLENKEKLTNNGIGFWEDPFEYIISHIESFLVRNLDTFVDTQFCNDYLLSEVHENHAQEQAATIINDPALLGLFVLAMKGLLREQVSLINKPVIISAFIEAKATCTDPADFIRIIRLQLKNDLAFNNAPINRVDLPASIEEVLERDLVVEDGKTFLAMLPADCRERLGEIRDLVDAREVANGLVLITSNSRLRVHLKRLIDLEFPTIIVASREELKDHQNAEHK